VGDGVVFDPRLEMLADRIRRDRGTHVHGGIGDCGLARLLDGLDQTGRTRWGTHRAIVPPLPTVTGSPARTVRALLTAVLLTVAGCGAAAPAAPGPTTAPPTVPTLRPDVLAELPHDPSAFTQGFEIDGGVLYEGTGLEGRSQLRELNPDTGAVLRSVPLPGELFGEGITVVGDRIWQLTWQDGVVLEWDRATLTLRREVPIQGEGWGLCDDGGRLVRSDGTDRLRFHDPVTFAEQGSVAVTLDGAPVDRLNELECVDGQVWANVWQTDRIVRIDPATGRVTAVVDAAGLLDPAQRADTDVLNGIAAVPGDDGTFLITGKLWPVTFRVRFVS
jgi:glutaminyl-peptide cyclotransferase